MLKNTFITKTPIKDKKIKAMDDYFRKIVTAYELLAQGEKPAYYYPSLETVKVIAHANKHLRAEMPLYFIEEKDEGEFQQTTALLEKLRGEIPKEGAIRAQILFFSSTHYLTIDIHFSAQSQECFVLDAADMSGGPLAKALAETCTAVYYSCNI